MLIFLYGQDTFRSREKLKQLTDRFLAEVDPGGSGLVRLDGETAGLERINEAVAAPSLFSSKRLIVVERLFSNQSKTVNKDVLAYLQKSKIADDADKDNIVVFWDEISGENKKANKLFQFLAKQSFAQEFKPLSGTAVTDRVKQEAKAEGVDIRQQAAAALASLCGNDLWRIKNELARLAAYCKAGNEREERPMIELSHVQSQVRGVFDENIFALTDAISQRNKGLALELLEKELEAGLSDSYLLYMIERQFRILLQVRQGLDQGLSSRQLISQLKLHPFVVQKCLLQVRNFSLPVLSRLFQKTVSMDRSIKTGQIDCKTAVSLLIVAF